MNPPLPLGDRIRLWLICFYIRRLGDRALQAFCQLVISEYAKVQNHSSDAL